MECKSAQVEHEIKDRPSVWARLSAPMGNLFCAELYKNIRALQKSKLSTLRQNDDSVDVKTGENRRMSNLCFFTFSRKSFSFALAIKYLFLLFIVQFKVWVGHSQAATHNQTAKMGKKDAWGQIAEKLRIETFSEVMSPAFDPNRNSVPLPSGDQYVPANFFHISWVDYDIGNDFKLVYWQRMILTLAPNDSFNGINYILRNPRFALRKVNVFKTANLSTTYDFYFQPGWAPESTDTGKHFEVGLRTSSTYTFPRSRWTMGLVTEMTSCYFDRGLGDQGFDSSAGSDFYGWALGWASYQLSPTVSLQHASTVALAHHRGSNWNNLSWDVPGRPYFQNGVGFNVSKQVWTAVFINNYYATLPTLQNTWASLWVALTVL